MSREELGQLPYLIKNPSEDGACRGMAAALSVSDGCCKRIVSHEERLR